MILVIASASDAAAERVTVPANVGIGPAGYLITPGPIFGDQPVHFGLRFSIFAIIDRETRRRHARRIPRKYRKASRKAGDIRISSLFIPSSLFISPPIDNTQIYGITFRPLGLTLPFEGRSMRFDVGAGLLLTYAFMHSSAIPSPTHFLRPGIDLKAEFEIPVTKSFLFGFGWASQFYPPQPVGGSILELGGFDDSIWHIGQPFVMFHSRFPYTTNL